MNATPDTPPQRSAIARAVPECWKTIGVLGGDRSCVELERLVHCHNCPVHSKAANELLKRPVPAGYRDEWSAKLALRAQESPAGRTSILIFVIGGTWLALPIAVLHEVLEVRPVRTLPHQRCDFVMGVVAVRGELLICFSLLGLLARPTENGNVSSLPLQQRLLVAGSQGHRQVFPVDGVGAVHRFHAGDLESAASAGSGPGLIKGILQWQGKHVAVLDEDELFAAFNRNLA